MHPTLFTFSKLTSLIFRLFEIISLAKMGHEIKRTGHFRGQWVKKVHISLNLDPLLQRLAQLTTHWQTVFDLAVLYDSLHSTLLLLRILLHVLTFEARLLIHMDHNVAIVVQVSLGILLLLHAALHAMHVSHYSFLDFWLKLKLTI